MPKHAFYLSNNEMLNDKSGFLTEIFEPFDLRERLREQNKS